MALARHSTGGYPAGRTGGVAGMQPERSVTIYAYGNTMTSGAATPARPRLVGGLGLAAVGLAWGLNWPAMAIAFRDLDVWSVRAIVVLPGGLLLLAIARAQGERLRLPPALWLPFGIAALLNVFVWQLFVSYGVLLLNVGRATILGYTMPLWAALIGWWWLRQPVTPLRGIALLLGLAAMALLLGQDLSGLRNAPLGAALTVAAAIAWGIGTVAMKRHAWGLGGTAQGAWQLIIGGVPFAVGGLFTLPGVDTIGPVTWAMIGYMLIVAMGLGYAAWFRVVAVFPPVVCGISSLSVPVVGVLAGAWLLDEPFGWREAAALALVCLSVALVLWPGGGLPGRRRRATMVPDRA
jgi:drug/metabolite transporter (DMT)-like permease